MTQWLNKDAETDGKLIHEKYLGSLISLPNHDRQGRFNFYPDNHEKNAHTNKYIVNGFFPTLGLATPGTR